MSYIDDSQVIVNGKDFMDSAVSHCHVCGREFFTTATGITHHLGDGSDGIDHDADGDHVPYGETEP